jgi:hypothetical protein
MMNKPNQHHLLILSQHFEIYKQLIEQASLSGLSILAVDEPNQAIKKGSECDLVFGEPSLVSQVI